MAKQAELGRAAVLGWPVSHSLSPRLHSYWIEKYKIGASYEAIVTPPEALRETLITLLGAGYAGVNLTLPHKEAALSMMDTLDEKAGHIGSVNTVVMRQGKLHGLNTDAYGFKSSLHAAEKNLQPGNALMLGAGGAARAICAALLEEGWKVVIASRTRQRADAIREWFGAKNIENIAWEDQKAAMKKTSLLINTTPLGMKGHDPLTIDMTTLAPGAVIYDAVYAPSVISDPADPTVTPLVFAARTRGFTGIPGLGMLLYQAQPAFEAWFGVRPEVTEDLFKHMREALG